MDYEYRVIPAPKRLKRIKGVSSMPELFAAMLTDAINAEARQGWEYVRSESLAAEEPAGWLRRAAMVEETMMIFRRERSRRVADRAGRDPADETEEVSPRHEGRTAGAAEPRLSGRPLSEEPRLRSGGPYSSSPLLRPVPRQGPGDKK
jgi:hypothetical protein